MGMGMWTDDFSAEVLEAVPVFARMWCLHPQL